MATTGNNHEVLTPLTLIPMKEPIPLLALDKAFHTEPFISIPGTFNLRTLNYPPLPPNLLYRSGSLSYLTPEGAALLTSQLSIKLILDLRSSRERQTSPAPEIPGVDVKWFPTEREPQPTDIKDFMGDKGGEHGFSKMYIDTLEVNKPSYKHVLEYLRDSPEQAVLFHCTAGKDRTGVLAALVLSLVGVPDEVIAQDYALTRIGIEPQKETLTSIITRWKPEWTEETPGFNAFSQVKAEYMMAFLEIVRREYGGMEGYAKSSLGLSEEDVEKIRRNLTVEKGNQ
jgi:protein tyrosine/serine phosphatase